MVNSNDYDRIFNFTYHIKDVIDENDGLSYAAYYVLETQPTTLNSHKIIQTMYGFFFFFKYLRSS